MLYSSRRDFCTCVSFIYFTPLKYPALYRKKSDIRGSTTERKMYTTANGFHQAVNLKKPTHMCLLFFLIKHQLKCTLFCWYYKECVYLQNACRPRGFELWQLENYTCKQGRVCCVLWPHGCPLKIIFLICCPNVFCDKRTWKKMGATEQKEEWGEIWNIAKVHLNEGAGSIFTHFSLQRASPGHRWDSGLVSEWMGKSSLLKSLFVDYML